MLAALLLSITITPPGDSTIVVAGAAFPMVHVSAGEFVREVRPDKTQRVVLTRGFWLGKHEVTWEVWEAVMGWSDGRGQRQHPARRMSWTAIQEFLERASESVDGWEFRLPSEAEWEYAARAGTTSSWASGSDSTALVDLGWIRANANGEVQAVGGLRPNAWGLHDMHGNVWEWVSDWMAPYPDTADVLTDPTGPARGIERVRRGGSAVYGAAAAQSSHRYQQPPDQGNGNLGFRIVATPAAQGSG